MHNDLKGYKGYLDREIKGHLSEVDRFFLSLVFPSTVYHWLDVNLRMRILGLGKATEVAPLSEEAAVELGAEMIGETFIFTVAVGCLAFEYWRQARKEAKHENKQTDAIDRLESRVNELGMLLEQQDARLREMNRIILTRTPASKSS